MIESLGFCLNQPYFVLLILLPMPRHSGDLIL